MYIRDENPCYYKQAASSVKESVQRVLMLPLSIQYKFSEDSGHAISPMLLETQWAILHEDVFVFEIFTALPEHRIFCIQHENSTRSLPSSVFAAY